MPTITNYPMTNATLLAARDAYFYSFSTYANTYGDISTWDVSGCTNMNSLFSGRTDFNGDISKWNVGNVTNMSNMFVNNYNFNADLSGWNVGKVTNMSYMFQSCTIFNADLSAWNVGNVSNLNTTFYGCLEFVADISNWNVRNVTNMNSTFRYLQNSNFNVDIGKWNVSKVTDMGFMFYQTNKFCSDISKWDVRNIHTEPSGFKTGNLIPTYMPIWGTWPLLQASLSSLILDSTVATLSPTFLTNSLYYVAVNTSRSSSLTLTPTTVYGTSTITVNGNTISSGSAITLTFANSSNTITIIVTSSTAVTCTYIVTFTPTYYYSTILSAFNTVFATNTQRFQMNLDNTTLTDPIVQFVQDVSNSTTGGYTSNSVNQRFIFGSSSLTNPLELNSTVNSTGTSVSSNVKASNFLLYSDVRLKENIEELSEGQGVDDIRVVQYNNKCDHSKHFGVIAHELAEVYPELVQGTTVDESNMQSVSYIELIPICINVIQTLKKKRSNLQLRLDKLKSKLNESC
jgi:surface protein